MTYSSKWEGMDCDPSGYATFAKGEVEHVIKFESFKDYHIVCQMLSLTFYKGRKFEAQRLKRLVTNEADKI